MNLRQGPHTFVTAHLTSLRHIAQQSSFDAYNRSDLLHAKYCLNRPSAASFSTPRPPSPKRALKSARIDQVKNNGTRPFKRPDEDTPLGGLKPTKKKSQTISGAPVHRSALIHTTFR